MTGEVLCKIILIDDHTMVRMGLAELLGSEPGLEIIAEAASRDEAIELIQSDLLIDVVLLDLTLKNIVELDLIRKIRITRPESKILIVSMHDEVMYAPRAILAGANGYVMKQESADILIEAVRTVSNGGVYLSENAKVAMNSPSNQSRLTPAEEEVYQLVGEGMSSAQIAEAKFRSIKTIEAHRTNIRLKLGLKDGAELVRHAILNANPGRGVQ